MPDKKAPTDHPVHPLIEARWSPYVFADRPVPEADLCSLFEAARWAASSYNEQPWGYIVAAKGNPAQYEALLSCLAEGNRLWAKTAPVLVLSVVNLKFARNGKENRAAMHDMGLAAGNLVFEASARGLSVHQMIGILPDRAKEIYAIPEDLEAYTGLAIGYPGDAAGLPDALKERNGKPRQRKPLRDFVCGGKWGDPSPWVLKKFASE